MLKTIKIHLISPQRLKTTHRTLPTSPTNLPPLPPHPLIILSPKVIYPLVHRRISFRARSLPRPRLFPQHPRSSATFFDLSIVQLLSPVASALRLMLIRHVATFSLLDSPVVAAGLACGNLFGGCAAHCREGFWCAVFFEVGGWLRAGYEEIC